MAFVNELIPDAKKEEFTFPADTRLGGYKPTLWKWTVDWDRDVFLVNTHNFGGGAEGTQETQNYVMNWGGNLIHFSGTPSLSGSKGSGQVMSWRVHNLVTPPSLQNKTEEVMQLIREALDAMGLLYKRERVAIVNVEFDLSSSR
jgi:hypothetical protein